MSKLAYSFLHLPQRVELLLHKYESRSEIPVSHRRPCFTSKKASKVSEREQWRWDVCLELSFEHLQKQQWLFWREDIYTLTCFSSTHQRLKTLYLTGHWMLLIPWEEVLETLFKNLQVKAVFTQPPHFSAMKNWPVLKWSDLENVFLRGAHSDIIPVQVLWWHSLHLFYFFSE